MFQMVIVLVAKSQALITAYSLGRIILYCLFCDHIQIFRATRLIFVDLMGIVNTYWFNQKGKPKEYKLNCVYCVFSFSTCPNL